jgi:hypothetical protein
VPSALEVGGNKRKPVSPFFPFTQSPLFDSMKRRPFKSIFHVAYGCGWTAICEENKAWHLPDGAAQWIELPELPPIDDTDATIAEIHNRLNKGCFTREEFAKEHDRLYGTDMGNLPANFFDPSLGQPWPEDQAYDRPVASSEPIAYQGLRRQDLPIRDWANLAAIVDRAKRVLLNSITNRSIDVGCVLRFLIEDIRNELGLPKPGEAAK